MEHPAVKIFAACCLLTAAAAAGCNNKKAETRVMEQIDSSKSVYFITFSKSYMFESDENAFDFIMGRVKTAIYAGTITPNQKPATSTAMGDIVFFDKDKNRLMEAKIFQNYMLFNNYYYRFDGDEVLSHARQAKKELHLPPKRMIR